MNVEQFLEAAKAAIEDAAEYHETVATKRVISDVQPGYLSSLMSTSAPIHPELFSAIRADFHDNIMPGMTHWHSPRFMAFFSCHSSYPAIVAEIYANALSGAYFNWIRSPAATELEPGGDCLGLAGPGAQPAGMLQVKGIHARRRRAPRFGQRGRADRHGSRAG